MGVKCTRTVLHKFIRTVNLTRANQAVIAQ